MSKLRKKSVKSLHSLLADTALHWQEPVLSEPLRRYTLAHGAYHLRAFGNHEGLWKLLRDETYRRVQLATTEQYEAGYRALQNGVETYAALNGSDPDNDARLCWLALRAGEFGDEAKQSGAVAFEWMRERPLDDERRVEDALERISVLDDAGFFRGTLLLLWIEADRMEALQENQRTERWARRILQAVEERIPKASRKVDWGTLLSVDLMVWLIHKVLTVFPQLDPAPLAVSTPKVHEYIERMLAKDLGNLGRLGIDDPRIQHATKVADLIGDGFAKAETLATIGSVIAQAGNRLQAGPVFGKALRAANAISSHHWKASSLASVSAALAQSGDTKQALVVCAQARLAADTIEDDRARADNLIEVASAVAKAGEFDQSIQVARRIEDEYRRAKAIKAIVSIATDVGNTPHTQWFCQQVLLMAQMLVSDRWRAETLVAVASFCVQTNDSPRAHQLCDQAILAAAAFGNDFWASESIIAICSVLAMSHDPLRAVQLIAQCRRQTDAMTDALLQAKTLGAIASALANIGQFDKAMEVANAITENRWQAGALTAVATALAEFGESRFAGRVFEKALVVASAITGHWQAKTLAAITAALVRTGDNERARQLCEQALKVVDTITDNGGKTESLVAIATALIHTGDELWACQVFEQALLSAYGTQHSFDNEARVAVALAFAEAAEFRPAILVAQAITGDDWKSNTRKANALMAVASTMAKTGDAEKANEIVEQALEVVGKINDPYWKAEVLADIAEALGKAGDSVQALQLGEQAREAAAAITDFHIRADCLHSIAKAYAHLGECETSLLVAHGIEENHRKEEALAVVASIFAKSGKPGQALGVAGEIADARFKGRSLAVVASAFARAGDLKQANQLCEKAIEATGSPGYMADAIAAIVSSLAHIDQFEQALVQAARITGDWQIADTLAGIAFVAVQTTVSPRTEPIVKRVVEVAGGVSGTLVKSRALATIGSVLAESSHTAWASQLVEEAIQLADTLANDHEKTKALQFIGSALVRSGNADRFEHLMAQLAVSQLVWNDLLPSWRKLLLAGHSNPCALLRSSMCHSSFSGTVAFNGALCLLLAHIRQHRHEAWMLIVRQCPQLPLDFLLEFASNRD